MYERLLSESEKFLEKRKEKEISILELWDAMVDISEEHKFEMPETIGDFECLIEADKRFVFNSGKIDEEPDDDIDIGEEEAEFEVGEEFFEVEDIEKIGFSGTQKVGLKKNVKKLPADDDGDQNFVPHHNSEKQHPKKASPAQGKNHKMKTTEKKKPEPKRKK
jgi:hypothetical protein